MSHMGSDAIAAVVIYPARTLQPDGSFGSRPMGLAARLSMALHTSSLPLINQLMRPQQYLDVTRLQLV